MESKFVDKLKRLERDMYELWDGEASILQQELWQDWMSELENDERENRNERCTKN